MSSTAACPPEVDQTTPFADRLVQIINGGALSLMLGIVNAVVEPKDRRSLRRPD